MSLAEWAALPEDVRGELVEGVLVPEEEPTRDHETVVTWLLSRLYGWLRAHGGLVLGSEAKLAVGIGRGRKPDLSIYLPGAPAPGPDDALLDHPPSLVVEVVAPHPRDARRDAVEKLHDYAALGVETYWILNPALRSAEVFELDARGRYARATSAKGGDLEVRGCPGLKVDLDALWAAVARAADDPFEGY